MPNLVRHYDKFHAFGVVWFMEVVCVFVVDVLANSGPVLLKIVKNVLQKINMHILQGKLPQKVSVSNHFLFEMPLANSLKTV